MLTNVNPANLLLIMSILALSGCEQMNPTSDMYVVLDRQQTPTFPERLKAITHQIGLDSWSGVATDDRGRNLYVIQGRGQLVSMWAQNLPINSHEDPRCDIMGDREVDPQQFIVSIKPRFPLFGQAAQKKTFGEMRQELVERGYRVLDRPVACSLLLVKPSA